MAKKQMMDIRVHPKNVLIKITKHEWNEMFSIWVTRNDGSRMQLFTDVEEEEGFDRRFRQNVSVGNVVAVGDLVQGVKKGDIAIIDYLVTANDDAVIGYQGGNRLVSIPAHTTYHKKDSAPMIDGRKTWKGGDFDFLSSLLGVVRMGKIISFHPYVFLKYETTTKLAVGEGGLLREKDYAKTICKREVISAAIDSGYKDGDKVLVSENDLFSRHIQNKEISVVFERDIIACL